MRFNTLVSTRHGPMLANRNDIYVGMSLITYGEFSHDEAEFLCSVITPEDTVIEVGANIGALTVPIAQKANYVIAYEPQRLPFQTLCANLALNSIGNVLAINAAVGKESGTAMVPELDPTVTQNFGGASIGTGRRVPQTTLTTPCQLIKLDCEGMEAEVLEGAAQMIEKSRPLLYVENDRDDKRVHLQGLIAQMGYESEWHLPKLFSPENYRGSTDNIFGGDYASKNMFCVPRERAKDYRAILDKLKRETPYDPV